MPIEVRRAYLERIRERYKNAPKKEKTKILDEFCLNCEYTRKYAIRILRRQIEPRLKKPGPKPTYNDNFVHHLKIIWEAMNCMCSKKMKAAMPLWLPFYKDCDEGTRSLLLKVSPSTMDRLLKPLRTPEGMKGISTTKPSMIKHRIPIQLLDSEVDRPGFIEADTVAHCGDRASGSFANTLTMTDLFSGWTENRAIWTKQSELVLDQIKAIEKRLPFNLLGFACDNGGEFLNDNLLSYLVHRIEPVSFVRRRPYKKNDAAHVEQKNFTHVRELFGYQRFDREDLVLLMSEIYQAYWNPLWNYFTPVMKLKEKIREGAKVKKIYDQPKTPCQRLIDSPHVPEMTKKKLKQEVNMKNPFFLKRELDQKLKLFFKIVEIHNKEKKLTGS